jgi:iron complex outermembrane recepter protein
MKQQLYFGVALTALAFSGAAFAQSSGTIDAEEEIIVTGARGVQGVEGVVLPDSPKARTVLNNEFLSTQSPGQSVFQTLNIVPSVNFTNNDPFGSSGGNIRIRSFDGNRISVTFDGLPLNDTGNYAVFSNQQLDPEIIDSVNVNQGTTDIDSPTAAASGGTINYRSLTPSEEFGAVLVGAYGGTYEGRRFHRVLGLIQTGDIFGTGIRAFASASSARNDKWKGPGEIAKEQYNIKFFKAFNGSDFVALSGHYNRNRNFAYRTNYSLAQANADLADNGRFDYDNNSACLRPVASAARPEDEGNTLQPTTSTPNAATVANPQGLDNTCTNYAGVRLNPSNTGNVRFNSKFSLNDKLTLAVDAGYQYVLATGGTLFTTIAENDARLRGAAPGAAGVDLNGDGSIGNFGTLVNGVFTPQAPTANNFIPDRVAHYSPSVTNTNRFTFIGSLRYDFTPDQSVRIAYVRDYGRHAQTGVGSFLNQQGDTFNVFGGRGGVPAITAADGVPIRFRDRFSIAALNQISGEYRGKFFDDKLEVTLGVRAPFFFRNLNQFCYTQASNGNALCTSQPVSTLRIIGPNDPIPTTGATAYYAPFGRNYRYKKVLPNVGATYRFTPEIQGYASYAKGLSAPRTDNLYRQVSVNVEPETTDNFDVGVRYNASRIQASVGLFYNKFQNRIVSSFDDVQNISVDRNVGRVDIKGAEASFDVRPTEWLSLRAFGSYIDARYKDDIRLGTSTTANGVGAVNGVGGLAGVPIIARIAGKKLVETPEWQYGFRVQGRYKGASLAVQYKRVTPRFATDVNDVIVPGYGIVDLDARVSLRDLGLKKTFLQLNVTNLFDKQYLGSISSQIVSPTNFGLAVSGIVPSAAQAVPGGGTPGFAAGSPRAWIMSLQIGF